MPRLPHAPRVRTVALLATATALALPATAAADYGHIVSPGESLTSIATADGLSVGAVAAANGLSLDAPLEVGQVVEIPPRASGTASTAGAGPSGTAATATTTAGGSYVVQAGDTLSAIAARAGITVAQLAALDGLNPAALLLAGSVLSLPARGTVTASTGSASGAANEQIGGGTGGPYPTDETVSSSEVGSEASNHGVDSALAEAIGWQESGYHNDVVSSTGAVGVMQIEPATWTWINQVLTPGGPLNPSSAYDNVEGGVLLLHDLVAETGSDTMAAAAYYQGLESLREHGMYLDTRQYVDDVLALAQRFGG